ncbi:MAG: hypothetical protein AB7R00_03750 [Kofleriaceae bacterium]
MRPVSLDDVHVHRDGSHAVIESLEGNWSVSLYLGEPAQSLSIQEIVDRYNDWCSRTPSRRRPRRV